MDNKSITEEDKKEILRLVREEWGSEKIVSRGKIHEAIRTPGLVAKQSGKLIGFLLYSIGDKECEIVALKSVIKNKGIGSALIEQAKTVARNEGCKRLWVITTNDNTHAIEFYKKRSFSVVAVYKDAVKESRKLKPEIPLANSEGVPINDELELEIKLTM